MIYADVVVLCICRQAAEKRFSKESPHMFHIKPA